MGRLHSSPQLKKRIRCYKLGCQKNRLDYYCKRVETIERVGKRYSILVDFYSFPQDEKASIRFPFRGTRLSSIVEIRDWRGQGHIFLRGNIDLGSSVSLNSWDEGRAMRSVNHFFPFENVKNTKLFCSWKSNGFYICSNDFQRGERSYPLTTLTGVKKKVHAKLKSSDFSNKI